jgi:flagellar biosynthetic protein FlhB
MATGNEEQNKSEEATPFKLARAREKGSVARGTDLGFFAALAGFLLFLTLAGSLLAARLMAVMRSNLSDFSALDDPAVALKIVGQDVSIAMPVLALAAITLLVITLPAEILQLRGLIFSTQPLKPDFSRLNPAKGLKRLFSLRMLKEAFKSLLKFAVYSAIAILAIRFAIQAAGFEASGAGQLAGLLWRSVLKLLAFFTAAALIFAGIDQIIARREFAKQMRMSRSEITREFKEREGEPRIKAKRKQLHAEFLKQTEGLGKLAGSDLVLINPEHYAVALAYEAATMAAPTIRAKARNQLALAMRGEAARLNIPVIADPPLARALYRSTDPGREISPEHYRAVALHYSEARARARGKKN